ncbi:MAG: hypothetical protein IPO31_13050 [Candidatus Obscuribacter sp.]|nr:hypothetical protein [Candidatus Obscuribacter sp.]
MTVVNYYLLDATVEQSLYYSIGLVMHQFEGAVIAWLIGLGLTAVDNAIDAFKIDRYICFHSLPLVFAPLILRVNRLAL